MLLTTAHVCPALCGGGLGADFELVFRRRVWRKLGEREQIVRRDDGGLRLIRESVKKASEKESRTEGWWTL